MAWQERLNGDSLTWLLEPDADNPSIRYFALRDLLNRPDSDSDVVAAQRAIMTSGPVPVILDAQQPEGYWQQPGGGYHKYRGTVWQIMLLSEFGADPADERVQRGCEYVFSHTIASSGGFAASNTTPIPSRIIHCLNGNLLYALISLGLLDDPRVQGALDWQVQRITGEESIQQSGTGAPIFACPANEKQSCGWGGTKAMKALAAVPPAQRTPAIQRAIERGAQFLLGYDLAKADFPYTGKISSAWFKLGFPLSYWSDVLETLAALVALGYGGDARLSLAYQWLLDKQDAQGRWKLENALNSKMWIDIEKKGKPSKWITLRMLRVIKAVEQARDKAN
ncbi:MAG: nitrogen fixation protein NifH [Anaerolineaceae bacterium]|nr:nitrogen fixation protein NifH [Anaerolineaceae bacterium]